jgi:hypothetical protein
VPPLGFRAFARVVNGNILLIDHPIPAFDQRLAVAAE